MARKISEIGIDENETLHDAEQKVLDAVPGAEVPIITGGHSVGQSPGLGPMILVEVTDAYNPKSEGVQYFGVSSGKYRYSWEKNVPLGKPVLMPERMVAEIEGMGYAEVNRRRVGDESGMLDDKAQAKIYNTGMRLVDTPDGAFLTRTFRRWTVRRIHPEEMRQRGITIPR